MDDKHAKFERAELDFKIMLRRIIFYALFSSLMADVYASKAADLDHLTIWSWILHTLYFELSLASSPFMTKVLHGPSFTGAHALFFMYVWTMIANPDMEFDLAPPGRATWVVYVRAFYLHFAPIIFHWVDIAQNRATLAELYDTKAFLSNKDFPLKFWACLGGYFAMGLTWEKMNGDAAGTYNVVLVDAQTFVAISKAIGVLSCVLSFLVGVLPVLSGNAST